MADEEKEKAEKLAAAKKRFEELKKKQEKKGTKKGTKKKADKDADSKADDATEEAADAGEAVDDTADAEPDEAAVNQSKDRSSSTAHTEVKELYQKQVAKIEELEKENKTLKEQNKDTSSRLLKAEDELESLREGSGDAVELRSKAKDADRLSTELASVQRQLAQAQQAAGKGLGRRQSSTNPGVSEQLASKESTIESLELDLSNLRNQIMTLETTISERDASVAELEEKSRAAEAETASTKQELDALKVSLSFPSDETAAAKEDPEALTKRITVLESDLRTATANLEAAAKRASSLEQKIEALTKLHKESTTSSQAKDRELHDLRNQLKRHNKPSHVRDASEFELGEEETETGELQARIRALEAENFDLRRGVWRDQRAAMQPGMVDENGAALEDVDLNNGPYSPSEKHRGSLPRQTSTFQDVITSGINAFTGRDRDTSRPQQARDRAMSMGLMSDDGGFDEEAFRLAQEEEAKRRIERIKDIKRGLEEWKGWRVDIADLRHNVTLGGRELGPVFEV